MSGRPRGNAPPAMPASRPGGIAPLNIRGMGEQKGNPSRRGSSRVLDDKTMSKMDAASATKRMQRWQRQDQGADVSLGFFEEAKISLVTARRHVFGTDKAPPPWIAKSRSALSAVLKNPFKKVATPRKKEKSKDKGKGNGKRSKKGKRGERDGRKKGGKSDKKVEEVEAKAEVIEMEIPTTILGLVTLGFRTKVRDIYLMVTGRIEYAKRRREMEGASTLELIIGEVIVKPFYLMYLEVSYYVAAYTRVDDAFNVQRARIRRKRGQLIDIEDLECVTWHTLEALKERITTVMGFVTVLSILLGVVINEINFRGFIPSWALDCENPAADKETCDKNPCAWTLLQTESGAPIQSIECFPLPAVTDPSFQHLKLANTLLTAFLIYTIYIAYRYDANILSLRNHVEFNDKGLEKSSLYRVGMLHFFLIEVLLCVVHQIPYVQFDIIVDTLIFSELPSVYTSDSVLGMFLFLRVYVIWRWFKQGTFRHYDSRAYAIRLTDEPMSHLLAIKLLIRDSPFQLLGGIAILIILTTSYVYRVVESSQNHIMSVYYWDALWFSADTMTGLAFADPEIYPRSVLGRLVAVVTRILGMAWTSLLIVAVAEWLRFGSFEIHALRWLELQRMSAIRKVSAVRCIQYAWLYGPDHGSTLRQLERFRVANGKLRLFNASHRLPEATNFDMFVQATLSQKNQVSMLVEKHAEAIQNAVASVKMTKKATQTARKVLTHRKGDEERPAGKKSARFSWSANLESGTAVGASARNFGSQHLHSGEQADIDFTLPGQAGSRVHIGSQKKTSLSKYSKTSAIMSDKGVSSNQWVSGGSFGTERKGDPSPRAPTRRPSNQARGGPSPRATRRPSLASSASDGEESDDGSHSARSYGRGSTRTASTRQEQNRGGVKKSSIYQMEDTSSTGRKSSVQATGFRPFSTSLVPANKRAGSFFRAIDTTKKASVKPNFSEALFSKAEDDQYKLVINRNERDLMKAKDLKKQAEDATRMVEHLRDSNDRLVNSLGYEPDRPKRGWEDEEVTEQQQWERDWDKRLFAVEVQIKSLDENLMATLGQIMLLVQGLYVARRRGKGAEAVQGVALSGEPSEGNSQAT